MNTISTNSTRNTLRILGIASIALLMMAAVVAWAFNGTARAASEPVISSVAATSTDTTATITWNTDEGATAQVAYGTTTSYGTDSIFDPAVSTTSHAITLSALSPDTTYHYIVMSIDSSGNTMSSTDETFTTTDTGVGSTATTTEPIISSIAVMPTETGASITWLTNQAANSQVAYGLTSSYGNATTLGSTQVTSHAATIAGLLPSTAYHFQILAATDASSSASSDQTFMTSAATTTASTTEPVISTVTASPTDTTATITWNTDEGATSQVAYGTTASYGTLSALNATLGTTHSVTLSGLSPNTTYFYEVLSTDSAGNAMTSGGQSFTTTNTGQSTNVTTLQNEVSQLQGQVGTLENEIVMLMGNQGGSSTSTTPTTPAASIDQNGQSVHAGSSIDFGGRNFGHEEQVMVTMGGQTVATAHADGGGNFSTGSLSVPSTAGVYVYTFVGQTSGRSATATITVM